MVRSRGPCTERNVLSTFESVKDSDPDQPEPTPALPVPASAVPSGLSIEQLSQGPPEGDEPSFDIRRYLSALARHKWLVVVLTLARHGGGSRGLAGRSVAVPRSGHTVDLGGRWRGRQPPGADSAGRAAPVVVVGGSPAVVRRPGRGRPAAAGVPRAEQRGGQRRLRRVPAQAHHGPRTIPPGSGAGWPHVRAEHGRAGDPARPGRRFHRPGGGVRVAAGHRAALGRAHPALRRADAARRRAQAADQSQGGPSGARQLPSARADRREPLGDRRDAEWCRRAVRRSGRRTEAPEAHRAERHPAAAAHLLLCGPGSRRERARGLPGAHHHAPLGAGVAGDAGARADPRPGVPRLLRDARGPRPGGARPPGDSVGPRPAGLGSHGHAAGGDRVGALVRRAVAGAEHARLEGGRAARDEHPVRGNLPAAAAAERGDRGPAAGHDSLAGAEAGLRADVAPAGHGFAHRLRVARAAGHPGARHRGGAAAARRHHRGEPLHHAPAALRGGAARRGEQHPGRPDPRPRRGARAAGPQQGADVPRGGHLRGAGGRQRGWC